MRGDSSIGSRFSYDSGLAVVIKTGVSFVSAPRATFQVRRAGSTIIGEVDSGAGSREVFSGTSDVLRRPATISMSLIQGDPAVGNRGVFDDLTVVGERFVRAGDDCHGDIDGNNAVSIDEIIRVVNTALAGCRRPVLPDGTYEGAGHEILSETCGGTPSDLQDVEAVEVRLFPYPEAGFRGTLSGRGARGEFSLDLVGTVDARGNFTTGIAIGDGVTGSFTGRVVEKDLVLSYVTNDGACRVVGSVVARETLLPPRTPGRSR